MAAGMESGELRICWVPKRQETRRRGQQFPAKRQQTGVTQRLGVYRPLENVPGELAAVALIPATGVLSERGSELSPGFNSWRSSDGDARCSDARPAQ